MAKKQQAFETDNDMRTACESIMRLVTQTAGLKLFQVIQFMVQEQEKKTEWLRKDNERMRAALTESRTALTKCGFCGPGKHGVGDPEINRIDEALSHDPR